MMEQLDDNSVPNEFREGRTLLDTIGLGLFVLLLIALVTPWWIGAYVIGRYILGLIF